MGGFATVRAFPHPIEKSFHRIPHGIQRVKGVTQPPLVASEFTQPRANIFYRLSTKLSHGAQEPTDRGQWVKSELFRNALRAQGFSIFTTFFVRRQSTSTCTHSVDFSKMQSITQSRRSPSGRQSVKARAAVLYLNIKCLY